jgi:hypothetical protein
MRNPKFKVGDKVRVLRASTVAEHDLWHDSWEPSMNSAVGKIMTILYVDSNDCSSYPKYSLEGMGMNFPEFVLEKEIRIGQQLVFAFMKEV